MSRLVHLAKSLLAYAVVYSGFLFVVQRLKRPRILVLTYHRVTADAQMKDCLYPAMHVATSTFEAQLSALKRLYRVVPMRDAYPLLDGREPLRQHVALVTFDDGYRDNYEQALPVLVRQSVPATFFLSLDFVERGESFWFDRLVRATQAWEHMPALRDSLRPRLPEPLLAAFDRWGSERERVRAAAAFLKTLQDEEARGLLRALEPLAQGAPEPRLAHDPLDWDEVRGMLDAGMQMGAHGVRHGILTRMPQEMARREFVDGMQGVAQRVGAPVQEFAYPNGDVDDTVARLAAEAGVRLAFTTEARENRPGDDPLRLGRRNVCEGTSLDVFGRCSRAYFWCEITGVFDWVLRRHARAR